MMLTHPVYPIPTKVCCLHVCFNYNTCIYYFYRICGVVGNCVNIENEHTLLFACVVCIYMCCSVVHIS